MWHFHSNFKFARNLILKKKILFFLLSPLRLNHGMAGYVAMLDLHVEHQENLPICVSVIQSTKQS